MAQKLLKPTSLHRLRPFLPSELFSTKAIAMLCPGVQGPASRFLWREGRAVELKAQSLPNPRPLSDNTVGWESPRGSHERCYAGGRETISKKTWSTLFPPSAIDDRDIGVAVSLFSHGVRRRQVKTATWKRRGHLGEPREVKGGLTGRVGFDPRGYSDMGSPSNSIIRGKGLIFEGFCEIPGAKNLEVCQPSFLSHPSHLLFPSCSPDSPLTNPSGPHSSQFSPSSSVSYGKPRHLKKIYEKDDESVPLRILLSGRIRRFRVISLLMACPPGKWPKCERFYALLTLRCILGGRTEAPQGIETWFWLGRLGSLCFPMKIISWNVRGLGSRNKRRMVKDFLRSENPDVVMIQETKKENCDRRFVGSVWTVRNKDWVALPASGASGGILIIWDSKNLRRERW
ncbi:hypothetical protein CK203_045761 [Vitis vinifera]|uniref:Endonuclease/exonuclease/phosphatase domain-containing protein n=1 Tax=Vitis vinifera TaxID=29760 RepID=A0A438I0Y6_VITVI|nr:hypothetical protein CK203_045761 [Vitis vinifera]